MKSEIKEDTKFEKLLQETLIKVGNLLKKLNCKTDGSITYKEFKKRYENNS